MTAPVPGGTAEGRDSAESPMSARPEVGAVAPGGNRGTTAAITKGDGITVEGISVDRQREARDLDRRIDQALGDAVELLAEAFRTGAWVTLGFASWADYVATKAGVARRRIPAAERAEVFGSLRDAGMSNRQIAAAVGVSPPTVDRIFAATNVAEDDLEVSGLDEAELEVDAAIAAWDRSVEELDRYAKKTPSPTTVGQYTATYIGAWRLWRDRQRAFARMIIATNVYATERYLAGHRSSGDERPDADARWQVRLSEYRRYARSTVHEQNDDPLVLEALGLMHGLKFVDVFAILIEDAGNASDPSELAAALGISEMSVHTERATYSVKLLKALTDGEATYRGLVPE